MNQGLCTTSHRTDHKLFEVSKKSGRSTLKKVRLLYFTDPLCPVSYCITPQMTRLLEKYNNHFHLEYKMGGLMPLWEIYRNAGISTFDDMTTRWRNIGRKYGGNINGSVWSTDPPHSSFPPSIAYKAAQIQGIVKAQCFYHRLLQMAFIENKNISLWKHLYKAAEDTGLDPVRLKHDHSRKARDLFEEDLQLTESLGILGFPSFAFYIDNDVKTILEGYQKYEELESQLLTLIDTTNTKS